MSEVEVRVREDGTILIPAEEVADLGLKPGETLAVSLQPKPAYRRPSRGLLKGKLPTMSLEDFRSARTDRRVGFELRRGL